MPQTINPATAGDQITRFRSTPSRGLAGGRDSIDPTGGRYSAGLIPGFAVITRGPALGHGFWIDNEFLAQVNAAMQALNSGPGLKSRFTHPSLSGDGTGKLLGRAFNASVAGDIVRADLHINQSSHNAPDGDLGGYVLGLAEEDPEGFGTSIVFYRDEQAELEFALANGASVDGRWIDMDTFQSPDPLNTDNLPHVRLSELLAVDVVDDPAANPGGMFHRENAMHADAEALAAYVLGDRNTRERPTLSALSLDPDRVLGFVTRFLDSRNLKLVERTQEEDSDMPKDGTTQQSSDSTPAESRTDFLSGLTKYTEKFGDARGLEYFKAGLSWEEALGKHCDSLTARLAEVQTEHTEALAAKDAEIAELNTRIKSADAGETDPAEFSDASDRKPEASKPKRSSHDFAAVFKERVKS